MTDQITSGRHIGELLSPDFLEKEDLYIWVVHHLSLDGLDGIPFQSKIGEIRHIENKGILLSTVGHTSFGEPLVAYIPFSDEGIGGRQILNPKRCEFSHYPFAQYEAAISNGGHVPTIMLGFLVRIETSKDTLWAR